MRTEHTPPRLDYGLLRAYPYPGERTAQLSGWLLTDARDEDGAVRLDAIARRSDRARIEQVVDDKYGPWRRIGRGVITHNSAYVYQDGPWMESEARWEVISALREMPNIHGTPGGYPVRRQKAFTEGKMNMGSKGEDLTAFTLARYAEGLPVLNSVTWPGYRAYDFDHVVTAGNRVAIVDSKFSPSIRDNTVRLVGRREVPEEDRRAWEAWRRRAGRRSSPWLKYWDALYFNGKIHAMTPVDGATKLQLQFERMRRDDVEVRIFTAFNMDASGQLTFTVEGDPESRVGEVRHMALEAVRWVRGSGQEADPMVLSYLHSLLKGVEEVDSITGRRREGHVECVGPDCQFMSQAAA